MHCMTLRLPEELFQRALKVADGRPFNAWVQQLVEKAVEGAK